MRRLLRWLRPSTPPVRPARPSRPPDEFRAQSIEFLGEQDGAPERELKGRLTRVFEHRADVSRAYLARVQYGSTVDCSVVLALAADARQAKDLVGEVGGVFAATFNSSEHLDIVFLSEEQEVLLAQVCDPFFEDRQVGKSN